MAEVVMSADTLKNIAAIIRDCESGDPRTPELTADYQATNNRSTASGAYQFTDPTWANYAGFKRAKDAPPEVQDRKFYETYAKEGLRRWNASRHCWGRRIPSQFHGKPGPGILDMAKSILPGVGGPVGAVAGLADAVDPGETIAKAIRGLLPEGWLKRLGKMGLGAGMVYFGGYLTLGAGVLGGLTPRPVARAARSARRTTRTAVRATGRATPARTVQRAVTAPVRASRGAGVQGRATQQVVGDVARTIRAAARQGR